MKKVYILDGLDCGNCANKIEAAVGKIDGVNEARVDFLSRKATLDVENEEVLEKVKKIINKIESSVTVLEEASRSRGQIRKKADKGGHNHNHANTCSDNSCGGHEHNDISGGHSHLAEKVDTEGVEEGIFVRFLNNEITKIFMAILIFTIAGIVSDNEGLSLGLYLASYAIVGLPILIRAFKNIVRGQVFDENFLMAVATIGAFAIGEYAEGVAVMLFYSVGEYFQDRAVAKSRKNIASLMDIRPDYANIVTSEGSETVDPLDVAIGDIILIKPGEKVPLDGEIIEGATSVDTSALTGESMPKSLNVGENVLGGFINKTGVIKVKVSKEFAESTISKILELVENASSRKAKAENFITKFARYYTPVVVITAALLAVIPPVFLGADFGEWVYRALIFLVISCPCALVISIPLSFFGGIGGASKKGILIKGGNYLEALKGINTVVFDKTGTLTEGNFKVTSVVTNGISKEELLESAAMCESFSNHPIAQSIVKSYAGNIDQSLVKEYEEIAGNGVSALIRGKLVLCGNKKLMDSKKIRFKEVDDLGTIIYVAVDGIYKGHIVIADTIKEDSKGAIGELRSIGVKNIVMLTGDNKNVAIKVADELGIDKVYANLLPGDKVTKLEELLAVPGNRVAFVGDGVNDAPVLARADVGIAMGAMGSDAAIEAADVVIMDDKPSKIALAIKVGKKTNTIVMQNIVFALVVKGIFLILGAMGVATMWEAVFGDVGVAIIAILNAMRVLRMK